VLPAVAEVIFVHERTTVVDKVLEPVLALILELKVAAVVHVDHAVQLVADLELVEVRVGPTHRDLERQMNILERPCAWNLNGSPNRRLDLAEPDVSSKSV
jgi:hypothetical protein